MYDPVQAALDKLTVAMKPFENSDISMWWPHAMALLYTIDSDPLMSAVARSVPDSTPPIQRREDAPSDPVMWGMRAYVALRDEGAGRGQDGTILNNLMRSKGGASLERGWADFHRGARFDLFIRHIRTWIQSEIGAGALLEHAIERWRQRCEWFGADGGGLDERALQLHLHRFLFDSGFNLNDASREVATAQGRADFVIRRGAIVPVELKVWSNEDGLGQKPIFWGVQASDYPRDLSLTTAYLVVVCVDENVRLALAPELQAPKSLRVRDIDLHVRVVDLGRGASNQDGKRKVRSLTDEMLQRVIAAE